MIPLPQTLKQPIAASDDGRVRLTDPETQTEYVLLPAEQYDRLVQTEFDEGPSTEQEELHLLREAGERAGWNDPEMDIYDELDPRRQP